MKIETIQELSLKESIYSINFYFNVSIKNFMYNLYNE